MIHIPHMTPCIQMNDTCLHHRLQQQHRLETMEEMNQYIRSRLEAMDADGPPDGPPRDPDPVSCDARESESEPESESFGHLPIMPLPPPASDPSESDSESDGPPPLIDLRDDELGPLCDREFCDYCSFRRWCGAF